MMRHSHVVRLGKIEHAGVSKLFEKMIFAMPPAVPYPPGEYADEWNRAVAEIRHMGLELPSHYPPGLLFKLDESGRVGEHAPLQAKNFLIQHLLYKGPATWLKFQALMLTVLF